MFKEIVLEMSLKPFKKTDESFVRGVCRDFFEQWRPLLKRRDSICVMLWIGDGSELLDYSGDMDAAFEWGRFLGTANRPLLEDGERRDTSLHQKMQNYISDPPVMTYAILKTIVSVIKEEGKKRFRARAFPFAKRLT